MRRLRSRLGPGTDVWIWRSSAFLVGLRLLALCLHFLGPSPYGGVLVGNPWRFLPYAVALEAGFLVGISLVYALASSLLRLSERPRRVLFLGLHAAYLSFAQFDLEVVRWMGEHVTLSYLRNYVHPSDGMIGKLVMSDLVFSSIGLLLVFAPWPLVFWLRRQRWRGQVRMRWTLVGIAVCALVAGGAVVHHLSAKRLRRICPVGVSLGGSLVCDLLGLDRPLDPVRARSDLVGYLREGRLPTGVDSTAIRTRYPLWQAGGPGRLPVAAWKAQPMERRPNVVLVIMETWRAWNTGLTDDTAAPVSSPELDDLIRREAYYFPYVQSGGFPSVEGFIGIHLGIWTHPRKIIVCNHASIGAQSWTEVLRDAGYRSEILLGTDPSFSNILPWCRRFYEHTIHEPKGSDDGPLMDTLLRHYRRLADRKDSPFLLATWTSSTHPPYLVPGVEPAATTKERFRQSLRYSTQKVAAFIDSLKTLPEWKRTLVVLVGDHAQPDHGIRSNTEISGGLTPGHTWVPLAILGGWPLRPAPRRNTEVVPQIDLAPTLLEILDISAPHHFMGRSLLHPWSREFPALRLGTVNLIRQDDRVEFRLGSSEVVRRGTDRRSVVEFGLLEGNHAPVDFDASVDAARYTDMVNSYAQLLDDNQLFPIRSFFAGTYESRASGSD